MIERILSGGQTGVDRAALDVALALGIPCGGWCPRGRWAEDGPIPTSYPLRETAADDPAVRTEWNVRDADVTLILAEGPLEGGTALTAQLAAGQRKPGLVHDLEKSLDPDAVRIWLRTAGARVLNVAGPRESERPGIYERAAAFLKRLLV